MLQAPPSGRLLLITYLYLSHSKEDLRWHKRKQSTDSECHQQMGAGLGMLFSDQGLLAWARPYIQSQTWEEKKKTCEPGALQDTGGFNRMQCLCTRECDPVLESKDIWDKKMVFSVVKSAHALPEDLNSVYSSHMWWLTPPETPAPGHPISLASWMPPFIAHSQTLTYN